MSSTIPNYTLLGDLGYQHNDNAWLFVLISFSNEELGERANILIVLSVSTQASFVNSSLHLKTKKFFMKNSWYLQINTKLTCIVWFLIDLYEQFL